MPKVTLHTPAPDFVLPDFKGEIVSLSSLQGRNVLLVFNRTFL